MPFINERLEANRESFEKNRAASGRFVLPGSALSQMLLCPVCGRTLWDRMKP